MENDLKKAVGGNGLKQLVYWWLHVCSPTDGGLQHWVVG